MFMLDDFLTCLESGEVEVIVFDRAFDLESHIAGEKNMSGMRRDNFHWRSDSMSCRIAQKLHDICLIGRV
jgi:hypothetical protein